MALFQIAEPGESAAPHEHKLAIGIDLGTTNSLVATVRSGIAVCLNDDQGRPLLPSVVRYHADGTTEVGYDAQKNQAVDPKNTIVSVKRFMGRGTKDIAHIESMPYDFVEAPGMVKVNADGRLVVKRATVEEILGRKFDLQQIHVNLVTLSGNIDEDDDEFSLSWKH